MTALDSPESRVMTHLEARVYELTTALLAVQDAVMLSEAQRIARVALRVVVEGE